MLTSMPNQPLMPSSCSPHHAISSFVSRSQQYTETWETAAPRARKKNLGQSSFWRGAHPLAGGQLLWKQHNKSELNSGQPFWNFRDHIWIRPADPGGCGAQRLANQQPSIKNITLQDRGRQGPLFKYNLTLKEKTLFLWQLPLSRLASVI